MSEEATIACCVPDYQNAENYDAFVALCPPDERPYFKPFKEAERLRAGVMSAAEKTGQRFIRVKVTAGRWAEWCERFNVPREHKSIPAYCIWLYGSTESGENISIVEGL